MLGDDLWMAMRNRADLFFHEVNRVLEANQNHEGHEKTIGLIVNVMYNLDRPILQGAVTFHNSDGSTVIGGRTIPGGTECVYYIMFEAIGEGGEDLRKRLHPTSGGSGDIDKDLRLRVVEELKGFIQKVSEHGLYINLLTYQRGLMWMSDDNFRNGAAKELEEINGGNLIDWSPHLGYAMGDSMLAASTAAFG